MGDDEDFVTIDLDASLSQSVSVVVGVEHIHGNERHPLVPLGESVGGSPSDEFTHVTDRVRCGSCGTEAEILTTVSVDLEGAGIIPRLAAVATAAADGHLPPDHRWTTEARPDCPLCVAMERLEASRDDPTQESRS